MSPSGSCFECLIPSWWKTILGCREEPTMWGLTERTGSLGIDSWWYIIPDHFRSLCFLPNIMKKSPTPALEPSLVTHANPSTWEWVPGGPGVQDYWCWSLKKAKQMIKKKKTMTFLHKASLLSAMFCPSFRGWETMHESCETVIRINGDHSFLDCSPQQSVKGLPHLSLSNTWTVVQCLTTVGTLPRQTASLLGFRF